MMGIGFPELFIILLIIMIIFGAGKLPEIGSAFGNSIRNFKKSMKEADEIKSEAEIDQAVLEATSDSPNQETSTDENTEESAVSPVSDQASPEK
jgi:TatA/E family protein of Tat protein translocase